MRIVVDVQCAQSEASGQRGVGRYVVEIVKTLAKLTKDKHELILLANSSLGSSKAEIYDLVPQFRLKILSSGCNTLTI